MSITWPDNIYAGKGFDVGVALNGGPADATVSVTVAGSGCGTFTGAGDYTAPTTISGLKFAKEGASCTVTIDGGVYGSQSKVFTAYTGVLACQGYDSSKGSADMTFDPDKDDAFANNVNGTGWGLRRGVGNCGNNINYTVSFDPDAGTFSVNWDKIAVPGTMVKYVIVWKKKQVDSSGSTTSWTNGRPQFAWAGNGFAPALTCSTDELFTGTGTAADPFVATDPYPLVPDLTDFTGQGYTANVPAQMCAAQLGWTSAGKDSGGVFQIQYWVKVIDKDGAVRQP